MSKLPPVEKLPLAVRKSVRDDWDAKKADVEAKLTEILGVPWTIDVSPNQIFAYAKDGYAKENLGACIHEYFQNTTQRLEEFVDTYKEDGLNELNSIAHAHVMTLDLDDQKRFSYSGADIYEGQIRLLFSPEGLGSNISSCLSREYLLKALNDAPAPEGASLSFAARTSIRQNYDSQIEEIREKAAELLNLPQLKFSPNFEDNFAKLLAESKVKKSQLSKEWEQNLGGWTRLYFSGLVSQLNWQKFEDDEMLQEGFGEAVEKGEISFRIVDKLTQGSYNECVIEDGVLYLQTTPLAWGSNVDDAASKLMDKL